MTTDVKTNGKPKLNRIGLSQQEYHGGPSTLCPGCGQAGDRSEGRLSRSLQRAGLRQSQTRQRAAEGFADGSAAI